MKPSAVLLWSGLISGALYFALGLAENLLPLRAYDTELQRSANAIFLNVNRDAFLLMYFSAICLMLYSIWRDPEAEWTGAASDGIKRAAVFVAVGVVLSLSYTLWQSQVSVENDADVNLRAYYVGYITDALKTGGMTLYLHALASNQIPRLIDRATAREKENLGLGVSLFYASAFFFLLPLVLEKVHLIKAESPLSSLMWWLANVAYLPLLLSFSLLSMSYIARREREQRSLLTAP